MDNQDDEPIITTERAGKAVAIVVVIAAALIAYRLHPRSTFAADGIDQRRDATVEQSHAAHTPTLVIFTADWCPACSALHSQVLSLPAVDQEIANHYTVITIDLTSPSPSAAAHSEQLGIRAIPTLIRYDADGKETDRTHYLPPNQMLAWLRDGE